MFLEVMIKAYLQSSFPEGLVGFDKKFRLVTTAENKVVIAPVEAGDTPDDKFKEEFQELAAGMNFEPVYATERNFAEFRDLDEANEEFQAYLGENIAEFNGRIMLTASEALLDITAPGIKRTSAEGKVLTDKLCGIPYVPNVRIQFSDEVLFTVSQDQPTGSSTGSRSEPVTRVESGKPDRSTVISEDEITDLKIILGQEMDVNDIINSL